MRVHNIDKTKVQAGFRQLLEGLGIDLEAEHFRETPERAMRAWTQELCSGLGEKSFEFIDKIKKGDGQNGSVSEPDKIISFKSK